MTRTEARIAGECAKCYASFPYWLEFYGRIYDATCREWVRFRLWDSQRELARTLASERRVIILKARQLGITWLVVGYALWLMLYRPAATVLLFSRRDEEAAHLLGYRLGGMYARLPAWMQVRSTVVSNSHELRLSNGSVALAFPTTGGRSYTATLAIVDEADHVSASAGTDELDDLLDAVKPTVDGGGSLILLSTADKDRPLSPFKRIYRAAKAGENGWHAIFLPWSARPDRTPEWYAAQKQDVWSRTGNLDSLHQEYPANDVEALAGLSRDRRFAAEWLARADDTGLQVAGSSLQVGEEQPERRRHAAAPQSKDAASGEEVPALPGLTVWELPQPGRIYVIGADPAEGNPHSDESAACVIDAVTGDEVATLAGRHEPALFAAYLLQLAELYAAGVLVERNNHGHAVLLWLAENGAGGVLCGLDGRPGWLSTGRSKTLAYDAAAEALRDGAAPGGTGPRIRDAETLRQLMDIRGATLSAGEHGGPSGASHDDRATAWVLAMAAARYCGATGSGESAILGPEPVVSERETGGW